MKMRVSSRVIVCVSVLSAMIGAACFVGLRSEPTSQKLARVRTDQDKARVLAAYRSLPLAFERNVGQTDPRVQYLTHGNGYELFLTRQEAVLALWQPPKARSSQQSSLSAGELSRKASALRVEFSGANPAARVDGLDELARKTNYFAGNDRNKWITNVPSYQKVEYREIYPGIDLAFYGTQRRLEYDYVVSPGADPQNIAFKLKGSKKLHLDEQGNLIVSISTGDVTFRKPLMYQLEAGERRQINGQYLVAKNDEVRFVVPAYDRKETLVIDPVVDYSTYLGGSATGDLALGVAVDSAGNAFVTGVTFNATFPLSTSPATIEEQSTPDAGITTNGGAFVSEINPTGTTELFFSYISGDGGEVGYSVAVDPAPNSTCANGVTPASCVYVTGQTFSDNFPTGSVVTAYNSTAPTGGAPTAGNAFISKLDPYASGASSLLYSSYLASTNGGDFGHGVTVDTSQDAYITGIALAGPGAVPNFPILNGAQTAAPPAAGNAFLTVLNTTASSGALLYSTYLGGDDANAGTSTLGIGDIGLAVTVDANKVAYIVGATPSSNFPNLNSTGTFPNIKGWLAYNASNTLGEAFVAAINTLDTGGATSLVYSTYLGGSSGDVGNGIALAGSGTVFVTGQTTSTDFPGLTQTGTVAGQFPSPTSAAGAPFVTKLSTAGGAPAYSVLIAGTGGDIGNGVQVDSLGNVMVAGTTDSPNFPVTPGAFRSARGSGSLGDAFIAKLNPNVAGSAGLLYSSYFGGSGTSTLADAANAVALDATGNAYLAGQTYSTDFPVSSGAFQTTLPGGAVSAAFVSKLTLIPTLAFGAPCVFDFTVAPASSCALGFGNQAVGTPSAAMTFTLTNNTSADITNLTIPATGSGTNGTDFAATGTTVGANSPCTTVLSAGATCGVGVIFTPTISSAESGSLAISYNYNNGTATAASQSQSVELSGAGIVPSAIATVTPSTLTFTGELVTTTSAAQAVTVQNTGSAALNITATPVISGTNATDFAIATGSTCTNGASVAPGNSCVINVTFTPPANVTGARSAVLSIADNAAGSPQTVTISGTAWDFTVSAQAITVTAGKNGTITATVTGLGGFTGAVSLACSTNIPQGSCMTPTSVNASAAGATASVTVITRGLIPAPLSPKTPPISTQQVLLAAFALLLLMSLPLARRFRTRLSLAGAAAILVVVAGCSSPLPTPAGTYTVTISGTSGGLSRSTTVNVKVQGN